MISLTPRQVAAGAFKSNTMLAPQVAKSNVFALLDRAPQARGFIDGQNALPYTMGQAGVGLNGLGDLEPLDFGGLPEVTQDAMSEIMAYTGGSDTNVRQKIASVQGLQLEAKEVMAGAPSETVKQGLIGTMSRIETKINEARRNIIFKIPGVTEVINRGFPVYPGVQGFDANGNPVGLQVSATSTINTAIRYNMYKDLGKIWGKTLSDPLQEYITQVPVAMQTLKDAIGAVNLKIVSDKNLEVAKNVLEIAIDNRETAAKDVLTSTDKTTTATLGMNLKVAQDKFNRADAIKKNADKKASKAIAQAATAQAEYGALPYVIGGVAVVGAIFMYMKGKR